MPLLLGVTRGASLVAALQPGNGPAADLDGWTLSLRVLVVDAADRFSIHHGFHHATNPQYIDRNHAGILIIWDRLFGSFEPEQEPCVYGLTTNINSFNPL